MHQVLNRACVLDWLLTERYPFFLRSAIYREYQLCEQLVKHSGEYAGEINQVKLLK